MDANDSLRRIRALCRRADRWNADADDLLGDVFGLLDELVAEFEELDLWIERGGDLPDDWKRNG